MKRKKKKIGIILLVFALLIVAGIGGAYLLTESEHREGINLPIANMDFDTLSDGIYRGNYEGGRYKWRANAVEISVDEGRLTGIELIDGKEALSPDVLDQLSDMYARVIDAQSLEVDTISGATITSKAYIKSVEDALRKAQE